MTALVQLEVDDEIERAAWLRYTAATDGPWRTYDDAFLTAWEQAGSHAELDQLTTAARDAWAAVHREAWTRYLEVIGCTSYAERHQPVRLRSG